MFVASLAKPGHGWRDTRGQGALPTSRIVEAKLPLKEERSLGVWMRARHARRLLDQRIDVD